MKEKKMVISHYL